jgi:hypothetical protein
METLPLLKQAVIFRAFLTRGNLYTAEFPHAHYSMKSLVLLIAASAVSMTASAAAAATDQPEYLVATGALTRQVRDIVVPGTLAASPLTAQERSALQTVFGSEQPVRVEQLPPAGAAKRYRMTLPAHEYSHDTATAAWRDGTWVVETTDRGRRITSNGSWPSLTVHGNGVDAGLYNMTFQNRLRRSADQISLGTTEITIGSTTIGAPRTPQLEIANTRIHALAAERAKVIDYRYDITADSISAGGHKIDAVHLAARNCASCRMPARIRPSRWRR